MQRIGNLERPQLDYIQWDSVAEELDRQSSKIEINFYHDSQEEIKFIFPFGLQILGKNFEALVSKAVKTRMTHSRAMSSNFKAIKIPSCSLKYKTFKPFTSRAFTIFLTLLDH